MGCIVGDIGRCVGKCLVHMFGMMGSCLKRLLCAVPDVSAARPKSFLGIYYGRKAEKKDFKGTTGENVKLDMLQEEMMPCNRRTRTNSFNRHDRPDSTVILRILARLSLV